MGWILEEEAGRGGGRKGRKVTSCVSLVLGVSIALRRERGRERSEEGKERAYCVTCIYIMCVFVNKRKAQTGKNRENRKREKGRKVEH